MGIEIILLSLIITTFIPIFVNASPSEFVSSNDYCIAPRIVSESMGSITINVTQVMATVHRTPYVRSIRVEGNYTSDTVVVSGNHASMTYHVYNNTIIMKPRDLDTITGLKRPLLVELTHTISVRRICVDVYGINVKVVENGKPVNGVPIELSPVNSTQPSSVYVTGPDGVGVLNFLPNKQYILEIKHGSIVYSTNLTLTSDDDGKTLTIDLSKQEVNTGSTGGSLVLTSTTTTSHTSTKTMTSSNTSGRGNKEIMYIGYGLVAIGLVGLAVSLYKYRN